jgi:putative FmdB family regulatory protein
MIVYNYECIECGNQFEVSQRLTDEKLTEYLCHNCHSVMPVKRIITKCNFELKGGGWAKDGYIKNIDIINHGLEM